MEAEFRVGNVVYDSYEFPHEKGIIKSLSYDDNAQLRKAVVQFEKEESVYGGKHLHRLSFKPYELKGFTQERPWQPKQGEWIAVRDFENSNYLIVRFIRMSGNMYVSSESVAFNFAKPLPYFINENNKLK